MKIFRQTPDGLRTEYRIPKIKVRRKFSDVATSKKFSHEIQHIWHYVAERIFSNGKWYKLNYYMITYSVADYNIVSVGAGVRFEFSVSKQQVA